MHNVILHFHHSKASEWHQNDFTFFKCSLGEEVSKYLISHVSKWTKFKSVCAGCLESKLLMS